MKRIFTLMLCIICWIHGFGCAGVPQLPSDDYLDRLDVPPGSWAHDNSIVDGIQCSVYSAEAVKGGLYVNLLITGERDCAIRFADWVCSPPRWDSPSEFLRLCEVRSGEEVTLRTYKHPKHFILGNVSPAPLPSRVLHENDGQVTLLQMCAFRTRRPIAAGEYEIDLVGDWSHFLYYNWVECQPVNLPVDGQRIRIE